MDSLHSFINNTLIFLSKENSVTCFIIILDCVRCDVILMVIKCALINFVYIAIVTPSGADVMS